VQQAAPAAWTLSLSFTVAEMDEDQPCRAAYKAGLPPELRSPHSISERSVLDAPWMAFSKVRMRTCKDRATDMYKLAWIKSTALVFLYKPSLQLGNSQAFPEGQALHATPLLPVVSLPSRPDALRAWITWFSRQLSAAVYGITCLAQKLPCDTSWA